MNTKSRVRGKSNPPAAFLQPSTWSAARDAEDAPIPHWAFDALPAKRREGALWQRIRRRESTVADLRELIAEMKSIASECESVLAAAVLLSGDNLNLRN